MTIEVVEIGQKKKKIYIVITICIVIKKNVKRCHVFDTTQSFTKCLTRDLWLPKTVEKRRKKRVYLDTRVGLSPFLENLFE